MADPSIWTRLEECVQTLPETFRASEIIGWFRRHHPDVNERSLRTHIQGATSNVSPESRGQFLHRAPLLTRIDHGVYRRASADALEACAKSARPVDDTRSRRSGDPGEEWHAETRVQAVVVTHLAATGWSVLSVADTATRQQGIDIVARRGDLTAGIEVKGFPSRFYADPARRGEVKPTPPATQARQWYAGALLAGMRLRTTHPSMRSVLAFPGFPTYRALVEDTRWCLRRCEIAVWWVAQDGTVDSG